MGADKQLVARDHKFRRRTFALITDILPHDLARVRAQGGHCRRAARIQHVAVQRDPAARTKPRAELHLRFPDHTAVFRRQAIDIALAVLRIHAAVCDHDIVFDGIFGHVRPDHTAVGGRQTVHAAAARVIVIYRRGIQAVAVKHRVAEQDVAGKRGGKLRAFGQGGGFGHIIIIHLRGDRTVLGNRNVPRAAGRLVNAAAIGTAGADVQHAVVVLHIVIMIMPVYPGDQIVFLEVKRLPVKFDHIIFARRDRVVEHDNLHIGVGVLEIVCKPAPAVVFVVPGFVVAVLERRHDVVHIADLKGVPDRAVQAFKQFLAVFAVHIVVVAHDIAHGQPHVFGVHILNVALEPRFIANIARVDQKCRLQAVCKAFHMLQPFAHTVLADLRIGDLQKAVRRARRDVGRLQCEIVPLGIAADGNVVGFRFIPRRCGHGDEPRFAIARKLKIAVFVGLDDVPAVGHTDIGKPLARAGNGDRTQIRAARGQQKIQ